MPLFQTTLDTKITTKTSADCQKRALIDMMKCMTSTKDSIMNLQSIRERKTKELTETLTKLKIEEESNKRYSLTQNGRSQMIVMTVEVQDSSTTTSTNFISQTSKKKRETRTETRIIALSFEIEKKGLLRGMRGISTWKRRRWK